MGISSGEEPRAGCETYLLACHPASGTVTGKSVAHGAVIATCERVVAVIAGRLHITGECDWCDRLRRRCRSHRQF